MKLSVSKLFMLVALGTILSIGDASARIFTRKESSQNIVTTPTSHRGSSTPKKSIVVQPKHVIYKKPAPVVRVERAMPSTSIIISKKGVKFHVSNGRYYRYVGGRYIATPPPAGLKVRTLPVGYIVLSLMGRSYYYYDGVYYRESNREYVVVEAPHEVTVKTLPVEAELVTYEGKDYYIYDGKIYSIVITPDGKAFKVVGDFEM